jgi:hypothetical protein
VTPDSSPALVGVLAAGAWFGLFVGSQLLVLHRWSPPVRARVLLVGYGLCVIGLLVTAGLALGAGRGRLVGGLFGLMTMGCLFVLYAPAFYVVTNSLSVQSLILLLNRDGSLTRADLAHRFAGRELLEARLKTLARSGYVVMDEAGGVRISRRGRCLVAPLLALKSLWRLGSGG